MINKAGDYMKKSTVIYLVSLFLMIGAGTAKAQITINQSDIQGLIGNSYDVNTYETTNSSDLTTIAAQKGANQTFDFSAISSFSQKYQGKITYMSLPADIPGANNSAFANANAAMKLDFTGLGQTQDSTAWFYLKMASDGMSSAGFVYVSPSDVNGDGQSPDTLTMTYNPYLVTTKFPLSYQAAWKDTTKMTINVAGTQIEQTIYLDATVDGYGTLKTPDKSADCLRLKVMTTNVMTIYGQQITSTAGNIEYITKTGEALAANIQLDSNGNPVSASYTELNTGTPIESSPGQIARDYRLDQNYPNPFNPSTVISYNLKQSSPVKLDIYNSLGQKVTTLVNSTQAAGNHKVTFNASGLNSGLYFYKLQAGDFSQTKKMMLIK